MPKIISIGTLKGGVGKTVSVFNIAAILAKRNYKVLCIDIDPQGNLTSSVGINRRGCNIKGMELIFNGLNDGKAKPSFDDIVVVEPNPLMPNLDIFPSTLALHRSELTMALASAREYKLYYFIQDNKNRFDLYDYVLIDTNPSMSYVNQNAFVVSDSIIMPSTPDFSDTDGILMFMDLWSDISKELRIKFNIAGIFLTKIDNRQTIDKGFLNFIKTSDRTQGITCNIFDTTIPINVAVKESSMSCNPLICGYPKAAGTYAYNKLVDELFEEGVF